MARSARTERADAVCSSAYWRAGGPYARVALVAVGGYGRGELAPHSDLDLVLVADESWVGDLDALAQRVFEPLWDNGLGMRLDHAVRTMAEMTRMAMQDVRVAAGVLDLRHVSGDPGVTLRLRSVLMAQWRKAGRTRVADLAEITRRRHAVAGELAHSSVPDIKESEGGLRDTVVLRSMQATWLVDVARTDLERSREALLDVRDVLHSLTGRHSDRIGPDHWGPLADALGLADERAAQEHVRRHGRRIAHLMHLTWARAGAQMSAPELGEPVDLGGGVRQLRGEIVLGEDARPERDATMLLRCAALAAERGAVLSPEATATLLSACPPLPAVWPSSARGWLVRLLAAGPGLRTVWETLEETGAVAGFLPEWDNVRLLPHASTIHRYTVDRHMIETCVEASALIRGVSRPDLLMVAALLHDIGKGGVVEHSVAGEPIARAVAERIGFSAADVDLVASLVRHHLLLARTATTRDLDDPATADSVRAVIAGPAALELLAALTRADATATAPQAWTRWRAGLVDRLVGAVDAGWSPDEATWAAGVEDAGWPDETGEEVSLAVAADEDGSVVTVLAPDRVGLLADVAGHLASLGLSVRGAKVWSPAVRAQGTGDPGGAGSRGASRWEVAETVDERTGERLRQRIAEGTLAERDLRRLTPPASALPPRVVVRPTASASATVIEVRTGDAAGVVFHVCRALAGLGASIRSAHIETLGPQAVDVFYVVGADDLPLEPLLADRAAAAVRGVLAASR